MTYWLSSLIRPSSFERDMSWLRVGVAVRTAIDINLHRVALVKQARDGLPTWLLRSIIRTWLLSYIIDRTVSAQLGKPGSMRGENSIRLYMDLLKEGEEQPTADDLWVAALAVGQSTLKDKELNESGVDPDTLPGNGCFSFRSGRLHNRCDREHWQSEPFPRPRPCLRQAVPSMEGKIRGFDPRRSLRRPSHRFRDRQCTAVRSVCSIGCPFIRPSEGDGSLADRAPSGLRRGE